MNAKKYYDEKAHSCRTLSQGKGIRNTHNFIKAVLIHRYIQKNKRILDLGCGQGGDLLKIKYQKPSIYVGIDISTTCIAAAQERCASIKMMCRCHFLCSDFTKHDWDGYPPYDVINCQFAIQFAFASETHARFTFEKISRFLVEDGLFIGTMPTHKEKTYSIVNVTLPDDKRECKEYAVEVEDLVKMCCEFNLHIVTIQDFSTFYKNALISNPAIANKMQASFAPDPNNVIFVFQKRLLNIDESL